MRRAVIYARFSSDGQREESVDAQVRACSDFAKRSGDLIVFKNYIDRAKSGTNDRRPEFQAMIEDSGKDLFDVILIHKLDRFARSRQDSAKYRTVLGRNKIKLVSVTENLDDSPESAMMESVLEGMAEYYSKNLAREVMKGMKENAYKSMHTGGQPPLGLSVDPATKRYVIKETEAVIVRLIFDMYLSGMGYNKMVAELNFRGLRTKAGKPFAKNSIHDLLRNEKYAGVYVFNRSASKDYEGRRNNHASKDDENVIRIPGGIPAIVDEETFNKAQEKSRLNQRLGGAYRAKQQYLLTGIIVCGECLKREGKDILMMGNCKHSGQGKNLHVTYRCGQRHRTKTCTNKEIRREYIENYVLTQLERRVFSEKAIPRLAQMLNDYQQSAMSARESENEPLARELAEVNGQIANIVKAVSEGYGQASFVGKLAELEDRKAQVETRMAENRSRLRTDPVTEADLRDLLGRFREFVKSRDIPEIKKFIASFIQKVIVYGDHITVVFFFARFAVYANDGLTFAVNATRSKLGGKAGTAA